MAKARHTAAIAAALALAAIGAQAVAQAFLPVRVFQAQTGMPVQVVTPSLPDAVVGQPYRAQLRAEGGRSPYTWSLVTPGLPPGLALNPKTGEITGRPTAADSLSFTVLAADSSSPARSGTRLLRLQAANPLVFVTRRLPLPEYGVMYRVELTAAGGVPPLKWDVAGGRLPPGLALDPATGVLAGVPSADGDFVFVLRVADASNPPQFQTLSFSTRITRPLAVEWVRQPRLDSGGIFGSVRVWNSTASDFDLTVIIVAVNEIGKAFTLGYQKFVLPRWAVSVEVPFGFSLPRGNYEVHADAVGEVAPRNAIFRARRQHPPLRIE